MASPRVGRLWSHPRSAGRSGALSEPEQSCVIDAVGQPHDQLPALSRPGFVGLPDDMVTILEVVERQAAFAGSIDRRERTDSLSGVTGDLSRRRIARCENIQPGELAETEADRNGLGRICAI